MFERISENFYMESECITWQKYKEGNISAGDKGGIKNGRRG